MFPALGVTLGGIVVSRAFEIEKSGRPERSVFPIGSLTSCAFRFHPRYWLHRAKETCIASTLCVSAKTDRQLRSMYHLFPTPTRHSYVCRHWFACNTPCVHVQRTLFSPTRPNPPKHPKPIAPTWRASRRTFRVNKLDTWIFGCFGVPEGPK